MTGIDTDWMAIASQKIRWSEARQVEIARNIANADTPGFQPRDTVSFEDYLNDSLGRSEAVRTTELKGGWGSSYDGNGVVLEEQTILSSETEGQHRMAVELYRKAHDLLLLAGSANK